MRNRKNNNFGAKGNPTLKTNLIKVSVLATAVAVSIGVTFPSFAEVSSSDTSSASGKVSSESAVDIVAQVQATKAEADNCADPANVNGLAHAQQKTLSDMKSMILTPINTDNIFNTASKGGCFNALQDFPNLSASIPSLTGIADALKSTLIKYATRKVCAAVNDALEEVIGPINELMDEFSKTGQLDLTGQLNKEMADQLYKIDPDLGRVSTAVTDTYSWDVADVWNSTPGIVDNNTANSGGSSSNNSSNSSNSSNDSADSTPQAKTSGSFMSQTGSVESQQNSSNDSSALESTKSFLRSIF